jgi:hypothetical protein
MRISQFSLSVNAKTMNIKNYITAGAPILFVTIILLRQVPYLGHLKEEPHILESPRPTTQKMVGFSNVIYAVSGSPQSTFSITQAVLSHD